MIEIYGIHRFLYHALVFCPQVFALGVTVQPNGCARSVPKMNAVYIYAVFVQRDGTKA